MEADSLEYLAVFAALVLSSAHSGLKEHPYF